MSMLSRALSIGRFPCARVATQPAVRSLWTSSIRPATRAVRTLLCVTGFGAASAFAFSKTVNLDANPSEDSSEDTVVDPATSIAFPKTLTVPAKVKIPPVTLVGVGVRTVSFLGIKVYSVGFYADLDNPKIQIAKDMSPEEKVGHIVQNTSCVIRIVPTRTTSYTHLRDAFMRALQGRLALAKKEGTMSEEQQNAVSASMRQLKSIFPNSPLAKHTPLDIFLSAPAPGQPRALIFRDMGSIESDWVATEFVLHYFEGDGPSPPLKNSVLENLQGFSK